MNLLVLSGGQHPYGESTPILESFLREAGHNVTVTEDSSVLLSNDFKNQDALVFNTRREGDIVLNEDERAAMTQFIGGGKGFVCIHIATCGPKEWPEYHDVIGGGWITGTSFHPPYGQFKVNVNNARHPIANGISDFITNDELYMGITWNDGNDVFLQANSEGGTHVFAGKTMQMTGGTFPLAWTRMYNRGKVFVTLLGHNGLSFQNRSFKQLILNGVDWATSSE